MKLLEYEGKALLAKHGVPLPAGAIWPAVPEAPGGWVVKAQVLAGGRGKRGGIRMAADRGELEAHAAALQGAPVTTVDFDFFFRRTPANVRKLRGIAAELDAVQSSTHAAQISVRGQPVIE